MSLKEGMELGKRLREAGFPQRDNSPNIVYFPTWEELAEEYILFREREIESYKLAMLEGKSKENIRCQKVLERVFSELGDQGVTLDQLQQSVAIVQIENVITQSI